MLCRKRMAFDSTVPVEGVGGLRLGFGGTSGRFSTEWCFENRSIELARARVTPTELVWCRIRHEGRLACRGKPSLVPKTSLRTGVRGAYCFCFHMPDKTRYPDMKCYSGNPTSMIGLCQEGKSSPDALRRSAGVNRF